MDYEQTKVFCSESTLKNIVQLAKQHGLCEADIEIIDNHITKNVAPYLKLKYPMGKGGSVNKALNDAIKPIDDR